MISEDFGGSLIDMSSNRFYELQAFHDELFTHFVHAEFGIRGFHEITPEERETRLENFIVIINQIILKLTQNVCSRHFRDRLWYEYDINTNTILYRENITFVTDDCLCETNPVQTISTELPSISRNNNTEKFYKLVKNSTLVKVSHYHIIPVAMISNFFQTWLSEEFTKIENSRFNGCVQKLYKRLKRSMHKLLIVTLKNTREFSSNEIISSDDAQLVMSDEFNTEILKRAYGWL